MDCRRRLISGIICALLFAGFARADMTPVYQPQVDRSPSQCVCDKAQVRQAAPSDLFDRPVIDLDFGSVEFSSENTTEIAPPVKAPQHAIDLNGGPGSANLCLYALVGLGLCSAPHWIRRLHFGHIPEWYHDGGPFQIGHSFAVSPESLRPVPVYCFIQPDDTAEEYIPRHRLGTIVSLWRKSQFSPDVFASRGPPSFS
jgi:hypothetical protein